MKIRIKSDATSSCLYRNSASIARRGDVKVYWVQPWFRLHPVLDRTYPSCSLDVAKGEVWKETVLHLGSFNDLALVVTWINENGINLPVGFGQMELGSVARWLWANGCKWNHPTMSWNPTPGSGKKPINQPQFYQKCIEFNHPQKFIKVPGLRFWLYQRENLLLQSNPWSLDLAATSKVAHPWISAADLRCSSAAATSQSAPRGHPVVHGRGDSSDQDPTTRTSPSKSPRKKELSCEKMKNETTGFYGSKRV